MNLLLLDTSAFIGFARGHAGILDKLRVADQILVSPIVIGELLFGFARRPSPSQHRVLEEFLGSSRVDPVAIDDQTPAHYAAIRSHMERNGFAISPNDLWIAASAMQHGAPVLTMDRDFLKIPQILVDCFDPA